MHCLFTLTMQQRTILGSSFRFIITWLFFNLSLCKEGGSLFRHILTLKFFLIFFCCTSFFSWYSVYHLQWFLLSMMYIRQLSELNQRNQHFTMLVFWFSSGFISESKIISSVCFEF